VDEKGFGPRVTTPQCAAVGRRLAKDDAYAIWRASGDGTLDLVRALDGRIELHRVDPDGRSELVSSERALIGTLLWRTSRVRSFVRTRFGTDHDWAPIPRGADLEGANGEQQLAAAAMTHAAGDKSMVRVLPEGLVEIAVRGSGGTDVYVIDRHGRSELMRTVPGRHSPLVPLASFVLAISSFGVAVWIGKDLAAAPFWLAGVALLVSLIWTLYNPSEAITPHDADAWKQLRTGEPD
jgi:hypothetical protein